jgi:spermidine synthase
MGLDQLELETVMGDAYRFLEKTNRRFDAVLDDIYLTGTTDVWRPQDPTPEWARLLQRRLRPGGVALANFITGGHHRVAYRSGLSVFRDLFGEAVAVHPPKGHNIILVGGQELAPPSHLRSYATAFPRRRDRDLWGGITVRRPR